MLLRHVQIRELLSEVGDFWKIVYNDIRLIRMLGGIVLMIVLGRIECRERDHLSDDWNWKNPGMIELIDIGLCDPLLVRIGVENCRAILSAGVGSLPVELSGIMSDRKKHFEKLTICNSRWVKDDLHRFGVSRAAGRNHLVVSGIGLAAAVT